MKSLSGIVVLGALLAFSGYAANGQDKPKPDAQKEELKKIFVPVRVQVVLTEYDGDKKVAVLPYSFIVNSAKERGFPTYGNFLRVGTRIPIPTDKEGKTQYQDIGSNLDCGINNDEDGHYIMRLSLERSSLFSSAHGDERRPPAASEAEPPALPSFRSQLVFPLKDAQATEIMTATDPLNGHVYHLNVTVSALK
jgi:hypothetical protein